jgi:hypothetical protein
MERVSVFRLNNANLSIPKPASARPVLKAVTTRSPARLSLKPAPIKIAVQSGSHEADWEEF